MSKKHGMTGTKEHRAWSEMKQRCHNPNNDKYKWYGARGITVCDLWRNDFLAFYSHIGPRPSGYEIDRIDNDKGYEPGNVRWTTKANNVRNRRNTVMVTVNGEEISLEEYASSAGISYATAWARMRKHPHLIDGGRHLKIGERNSQAKLSDLQADEIRASREPTKVLQERFRVSRSLIQGIRRGDFRKAGK